MAEETYRTTIISEGGFSVEFANDGVIPKYNPFPTNKARNEVDCVFPGCKNKTNNQERLCKEHNTPKNRKAYHLHLKDWVGRLNHEYVPSFTDMLEPIIQWSERDKEKEKTTDAFILDLIKTVHAKVPDATTLQNKYKGEKIDEMAPDDIAAAIKSLTDRNFPAEKFRNSVVHLRKPLGKSSIKELPIRVLAALLATGVTCEEINRGDARYVLLHKSKRRFANVFMPLAYYFIRRYAGATPEEAKKSVKGY